ncbi:MAG: FGGY-family carbohydrate kinase [Bacteroidales bacterium]|nr:FGGY-family carbohydrate kinase [Bacteroidales bacterium]
MILSIDCGTQSIRALLFDFKGKVIDKEQIHYEPYLSSEPGRAEQHPEIYWKNLCKATQALKERNLQNFNNIKGVGITTLRSTFVNVDKAGNALRPSILWLDQRVADNVYQPNAFLKLAFKAVGVEEMLQKMERKGHCNWIKQNQPDIWKKTYKYLQISGYLNYKLTGVFKDSTASQIGHIPFDYKKQQWANPKDAFEFSSKLYPIESEKLPELIAPGAKIGTVHKEASLATGIPADTPVIAAGSDKGCETIGMGVIDTRMASLSFGTTATVQTTVNKYFEPTRFLPAYPAVIPGHWNPEIEIFRGFWMINWFKNEFALKEVLEAKEKNVAAEEILNELLHKSPPGAMGLMVQPYWTPGLGEKNAKGAFIGFGDVHKKEHVYRAVIEGLAYALLDGMHKLERRGNLSFMQLAVSGGASQSDEICQITADIFNLPLLRGETHETSGLGAAIVTAYGIGQYSTINEAVKNMVHYSKTFLPDKEHSNLYKKLYEQVYLKMFKRLEPLHKKIREITGYPEM